MIKINFYLKGMWGYANVRNRKKALKLYEGFLSSKNDQGNAKGFDQSYLYENIFKLVVVNSRK